MTMEMEVEAVVLEIEPVETNGNGERPLAWVRQAGQLGRKAFQAYLGLWGTAFDETQNLLERSREWVDEARHRGEEVEEEVEERARKLYQRAETEVEETVEEKVDTLVEQVSEGVAEAVDVRDPLLRDRLLALSVKVDLLSQKIERLDVEQLLILSARMEQLERKIDLLLLSEQASQAREAGEPEGEYTPLPIPGYDDLTAKEVVGRLDTLTIAELQVLQAYEEAHENRVTILREVTRRLERMPIENYDEMTVDEIEPHLADLTVDQLERVAEYEKAHEDRVTLLRAVERELEDRKEKSL